MSDAIHVMADADDQPVTDEKVVTEVAVQTGKITTATLHDYVQGYGTIETAPATADQPAAGAQLAAPSAGVVMKVDVLEGQHVDKGDVLVELNSQAAEAELERQKKLYSQQNTSLKNLQDAETQLAMLRVIAPLSGTVARVNVRPGQAVDSATVVAEVMDLNRLAVSAEIPAAEANDLKTGEPLEVLTEHPVTTELLSVSPNVNKDDDTVLVRALLPKDSGLRPGQFISLRIVTAVHTNCLAVPVESVVTDDSGKSVIALVKNGAAAQLPVQTGLRENGLVEIEAPEIKEGDVVVTVGAYGLPEKTKIRVQNSSGDETSTNSPDAK
ncbi:MAG TPA: efflux RND transporter periplasmic adaptor subunit [Dongiaceae bacterium]|nr:efflux RND transporter periplasmic adaptor subunit [Dongiaceae bacterium]